MPAADFARIWAASPIGITIYKPVFKDDKLTSMDLVWINDAVSKRANYHVDDMAGWTVEQVIGQANWDSLRDRFAQLVAGKVPSLDYARTYENRAIPVSFAYAVTAWYADPWVCVQVRDTTQDPLPYQTREDIAAALELVEARSKATLKLAELLRSHQVDPAGFEPAASRFSDGRSAN